MFQTGMKAKDCERLHSAHCILFWTCAAGRVLMCHRPGATPNQTLCGLLFCAWEMVGPGIAGTVQLTAASVGPSVLFRGCCFIRPAKAPLSIFVCDFS